MASTDFGIMTRQETRTDWAFQRTKYPPAFGFQDDIKSYTSVWTIIHAKYAHTHTHLMAHCQGLPGWASTRKVKPIWILLEQETVSGSGISWAICKSAPRSRQITTSAPHCSVFYRPDALLLPNQQRQSTEGIYAKYAWIHNAYRNYSCHMALRQPSLKTLQQTDHSSSSTQLLYNWMRNHTKKGLQ